MSLDDRLRAVGLNPDQAVSISAQNFRIREIFASSRAEARGIQNIQAPEAMRTSVLGAAERLAVNVLQPMRRAFGVVNISSWYRSAALNAAVGGAPNSAHLTGEAADCTFKALPGRRIIEAFLWFDHPDRPDFDQVILERRGEASVWLHVAYKRTNNRRELRISPPQGGYPFWDRSQEQLDELLQGIPKDGESLV